LEDESDTIVCWNCGRTNIKPVKLAEKLCANCYVHLIPSECSFCKQRASLKVTEEASERRPSQ